MVVGHMDAQSEDQYRFRDRIRGLRQGFDMKRPLIALFVGLFIFLPNTFYGYDAGVPFEDKKSHDSDIYEFLSYDFLRPEEYDWEERNNQSLTQKVSRECTLLLKILTNYGIWVTLDLLSHLITGLKDWAG